MKKQASKDAKIIPLGDRVLVRPFGADDSAKKNDYGIIIPDTIDKEKPEQGEVIAIGEGRYEDGKLVPMKVKVGDTVIFSKYGYDEIKVGEKEFYMIKEDSLLAVIK